MVRHTILFKVKHNISDAQINSAIKLFLDLKNKLTGIMTIMGGKCNFNEETMQHRGNDIFTHSISIDFKGHHNLDNFFETPITHSAKQAIVSIVEGGYEGIRSMNMSRFEVMTWNMYRFFQPAAFRPTQKAEVEENLLPNPLDRYRVPRLVLVPRGFK